MIYKRLMFTAATLLLLSTLSQNTLANVYQKNSQEYANDVCVHIYLLDIANKKGRIACYSYFLLKEEYDYMTICSYGAISYINTRESTVWIAFLNDKTIDCSLL